MEKIRTSAEVGASRLAEILRTLRRKTGRSQLELALSLGISQRHLSFVEIARARPSRDLLLAWLEALDAPISLCNAALLHAGYQTMRPPPLLLGASDPRRSALEGLVRGHEPCPALVFDADWYALSMTTGGRRLCELLMPDLPDSIARGPRGLDMIAAIGHPDGLLGRAVSPETIAAAVLNQFETEAWARPEIRERTRQCAGHLQARYNLSASPMKDLAAPHLKLAFCVEGQTLHFFTVQAVLGLPQDIHLDALRAELWFPEDTSTRQFMERLVDTGSDTIKRRTALLAG